MDVTIGNKDCTYFIQRIYGFSRQTVNGVEKMTKRKNWGE